MHIPIASIDVAMKSGSLAGPAPSLTNRQACASTIKKKMTPETSKYDRMLFLFWFDPSLPRA
jgi:hypothetical protein